MGMGATEMCDAASRIMRAMMTQNTTPRNLDEAPVAQPAGAPTVDPAQSASGPRHDSADQPAASTAQPCPAATTAATLATPVAASGSTASSPRAAAPIAARASAGRTAAYYGVLAAAALVCGYLEVLVPLPVAIPGVKLGLGNAVVLLALNWTGPRAALAIMLVKVVASTLLFANLQMLVFSLAGGLLSWAVMALAHRSGLFSVVATSVLGGLAHNAGQLIVVALVLSRNVAIVNAPILAVAGVLCGAAVGIIVQLILRALPTGAVHA